MGWFSHRAEVFHGNLKQLAFEVYRRFGAREDLEVRRDPYFERVGFEQAVAEGVECGNLDVVEAVGHQKVHARFHFCRGGVGEGEGEDFRRFGAFGINEGGDPPGENGGFPGARPRDHQERPSLVQDGFLLGGV